MIHLRFDIIRPDLHLIIRPFIHHNIFNLLFSDSDFQIFTSRWRQTLIYWCERPYFWTLQLQHRTHELSKAVLVCSFHRKDLNSDFFFIAFKFYPLCAPFLIFNTHLFRKYCFTWAKLLRKRQMITTLWIFQYFIRIPHMFNPDPKKEKNITKNCQYTEWVHSKVPELSGFLSL